MHRSDPTDTDGGSLRPRIARMTRTRPNGRALIGGLLVTLAGVAAFTSVARAGATPGRNVVVASHDLAIGQHITDADIETILVPLSDEIAAHSYPATDRLLGAVAIAPIASGELIQRSSVVADDGAGSSPEFSIPVDRDHAVNGSIRPGESVDVLATYGTGNDAVTVVLARDARVIRVEDTKSGALGAAGKLVTTLALGSDAQVLDAVHAAQVAAITLVRSTRSDAVPTDRSSTTGPLARNSGVRS